MFNVYKNQQSRQTGTIFLEKHLYSINRVLSDCFTFSLERHIFVSFNTKCVKEYLKKET